MTALLVRALLAVSGVVLRVGTRMIDVAEALAARGAPPTNVADHFAGPPIGHVQLTEHEDGLHLVGGTPEWERAHGYSEAPMLGVNERPWPTTWERDRLWEQCLAIHRWERTLTRETRPGGGEFVIRCAFCHVPRCGHSLDADPCMLRRHHPEAHVPLSRWTIPAAGS